MESYNNYQRTKKDFEEAKKWIDLDGKLGRDNKPAFRIGVEHCDIKLRRLGQFTTGGRSYWDSPHELNEAILKLILSDETIISRALETLRARKNEALIACKAETEALLQEIKDKESLILSSGDAK